MTWLRFSPAKWRAGMSAALGRFPFAIACGVAGAGCAIVGVHYSKDAAVVGQCERLAMTVALGLPLFFSLRILRERGAMRFPLELLGFIPLAAWFFTHSARPSDEPGIVFLRWALVLAALHFFAAISSCVRRGEGTGFWQFNRRLFLRFCLATLYTFILTAGLELALLSADKLFDLHLDHAYADLYFLMLGCFHPAFFLAGVPRDFAALEADHAYPRGLKAFTQFALAPLVLVYGLILYAYALKIIFLRSWPHGWVALPVLILSFVGIFAALLLHPLREDPAERWAFWFGRIFPPAIGPLAVLLLLSLRVRIGDYGVTEERYLGIVASFWIIAWSVVFTVRRKAGIRWIPASLALIALAAAFGPWSAGAFSQRSQVARVISMLKEQGLWSGTSARAAEHKTELARATGASLRSTIDYLIQVHGAASVQRLFASVAPLERWYRKPHWNATTAIMDGLDVTIAQDYRWLTYKRSAASAIDLSGFRKAWPVHNIYSGYESRWSPQKFGDLQIGLDHGVLKLAIADSAAQPVPLDELLKHLPAGPDAELNDEQSHTDFVQQSRSFRLVITWLEIHQKEHGPVLNGIQCLLLER